MATSGKPPLFLMNYRGGGLGDSGLLLQRHLRDAIGRFETIETSIDGRGCARQSLRAATYRGPLIATMGLTAWGRSGPRNFLGWSSLGAHRALGHPTKVLVHHAIEIFDLQETGYTVTPLVQRGAHLALAQVRDCDLVVHSPRLKELLLRSYGARRIWLVPVPGEPTRPLGTPPGTGRPKVVHAGYWALYKGIDLFIDLAERLRGRAEFLLVGRPHAGLLKDPSFQEKVVEWTTRARAAGIRLTGFLSEEELDRELAGPTVGILPYTSVSGASASFQMFAERGVPVVASDFPEFRYLEATQAGIRIAPATLDGLSAALEAILEDPEVWSELAARQAAFNERYSYPNFVAGLLAPTPP